MVQGGTYRRGYRLGIIPLGFYDAGKVEPGVMIDGGRPKVVGRSRLRVR
jgi:hypothetical protein